MKKEKKSFVLYHNFATQFGLLPLRARGELISAIFEYETTGEVKTSLSAGAAMAFSFIKDTLDRDRESYALRVETNVANGKKGGRPRKTATQPSVDERIEERIEDPIEERIEDPIEERIEDPIDNMIKDPIDVTEEEPTESAAQAELSVHALPFTEKTERFFEKPKKADNDNDNGNGNGNENDNAIGIGKGNGVGGARTRSPSACRAQSAAAPERERGEGLSDREGEGAREALTDADRSALIAKGVDADYLDARWERASAYARERGKRVFSVLLSWWERDRRDSRPPAAHAAHKKTASRTEGEGCRLGDSIGSTDDFIAAALRRSAAFLGAEEV